MIQSNYSNFDLCKEHYSELNGAVLKAINHPEAMIIPQKTEAKE
jgi:hypothetical protein